MTNLPQDFRAASAESQFVLAPIRAEEEQVSKDGTVKCAFPIETGKVVEGRPDSRQGQDDSLHQQPGGVQSFLRVLRHREAQTDAEPHGR